MINLNLERLSEEFINCHPLMIIHPRVAEWSHFVITCENPAKCVKKLLATTGGNAKSITLKIFGRFNHVDMESMHKVREIDWYINNPNMAYQEYLESICAPPDLTRLSINVMWTKRHEVDLFNIDTIKPTLNKKKINTTLRFLFPFASFPRITNNIDTVEISMGSSEDNYVQPKKLLFVGNKRLTITGISVVTGEIDMEFENVESVSFTDIISGSGHEIFEAHMIRNPVSMKLHHQHGIESIVTNEVNDDSEEFFADD
jgi:hypothetical protein